MHQEKTLTRITSGTGDADTDCQVALTNGVIYDEDIRVDITHANPPVNKFEQILTPTAHIPVYYLDGAAIWYKQTTTEFPLLISGGTIRYNLLS